ncbi:50S ribosomal protein L18 [Candidatus Dependentiae bacterium]
MKNRSKRRALRVKRKIKTELPRVSVFRSLRYIYAQIIDDSAHTTLTSCSSLELKGLKGDKRAIATAVGKELAKRAQEKGVKEVVFDRGRFLYHGRVKALAEGLREGGLKI